MWSASALSVGFPRHTLRERLACTFALPRVDCWEEKARLSTNPKLRRTLLSTRSCVSGCVFLVDSQRSLSEQDGQLWDEGQGRQSVRLGAYSFDTCDGWFVVHNLLGQTCGRKMVIRQDGAFFFPSDSSTKSKSNSRLCSPTETARHPLTLFYPIQTPYGDYEFWSIMLQNRERRHTEMRFKLAVERKKEEIERNKLKLT